MEGSKKHSWQEGVKAKLKAKSRISACVLKWSMCLEVLDHYSCLTEEPSKHPVYSATQKKSFQCYFQFEQEEYHIYTPYIGKQTEVRDGCSKDVLESKSIWTNERETKVAVNQVGKKESAHFLVTLQGSLVCPALSAFLFPVHYSSTVFPFFLSSFRRVHMNRYFQNSPKMIRSANKETHYTESNKKSVILVSWAAQQTRKILA